VQRLVLDLVDVVAEPSRDAAEKGKQRCVEDEQRYREPTCDRKDPVRVAAATGR
jgi:hypothetical protein